MSDARFRCTVSADDMVYDCPFDQGLGFFCGKCHKLLGHFPRLSQVCNCGARVEEAVFPTKRVDDVRQAPAGHVSNPGGLRRAAKGGDRPN